MLKKILKHLSNYPTLQHKHRPINPAMILKNTQQDSPPNRLNSLFQHIPGMVFEFCLTAENHASVPFASAGIASIYELNAEQVKDDASALFARIHPDDLDNIRASIKESAHSLQPWHLEYRVNLPQKGLRWLLLSASNPLKQEDGSIIWYGLNSDITERKTSEATLTKLSKALEQSLSSVMITDLDATIEYVNQAFINNTGYRREEIIGQKPNLLKSGKTSRAIYDAMWLALLAGKTWQGEIINVNKQGQEFIELTWISPIRQDNQTISHYLSIKEDITERKKTEIPLTKLSMALEQSQSSVMITDLNATIEYVNQTFVNTTGYSREEIIGQKPSLLKSSKTPHQTHDEMWVALLAGKAWQGEVVNVNKLGQEFIELTWISPIRQDNGVITHYLGVKEEITSRKTTEALLVAAKERAENLSKTKSQFLANMSHEIRTPMTAIMGFSDLALLDAMPATTHNYLQDISTASKHLLTILNDILDLSKLEAGQMSLQLAHFNLADLQSTLYGLFINTAQKKGLSLIIEIETQVPNAFIGDSLRLRQVLINLLGNAIKFTQQGSVTLKISLQQLNASEAQILFAVTDTGMGISAEQQDKLFQPFSQVDDGFSRNFNGTGLGLTISQDLVQLMGSSIKLDSHVGLGSCFSFELILPLENLSTTKSQVSPTISLKPEPLRGVRILVAEDDAFNQTVIFKMLKYYGARTVMTNNGLEALEALEQNLFDIVLMDLHMPAMNGYEATLAIRKQARYAQLPVIALSASVTETDRQRCWESGMNAFIAKPINKHELLSTLQQWLTLQDMGTTRHSFNL